MNNKWKKYGLCFFAFIVGLAAGYLRPEATQPMLSVVGIIAGLGFLFTSRSSTTDKKESTSRVDWFILIQMLMYFIIGAALSMSIALFMSMN